MLFTSRQKLLNWTSLQEKLSFRWSNQAGEIILTAGQFAQCLALNESPASTKGSVSEQVLLKADEWPKVHFKALDYRAMVGLFRANGNRR